MLILITLPHFFPGEAAQIAQLFRAGLEVLHLRKPGASADEMAALLEQLPAEYLPRIVVHDHFGLAARYGLRGVHLNGRNPWPPAGHTGSLSRSCHSLDEVRTWKERCDYVFLSPIFDSISKQGYGAAFTPEALQAAHDAGLIDAKVVALGGITAQRIPALAALGFGGVAVLGDVWQQPPERFLTHFRELLASIQYYI